MEFKFKEREKELDKIWILIESQWNLNYNEKLESVRCLVILIESQWNLNVKLYPNSARVP